MNGSTLTGYADVDLSGRGGIPGRRERVRGAGAYELPDAPPGCSDWDLGGNGSIGAGMPGTLAASIKDATDALYRDVTHAENLVQANADNHSIDFFGLFYGDVVAQADQAVADVTATIRNLSTCFTYRGQLLAQWLSVNLPAALAAPGLTPEFRQTLLGWQAGAAEEARQIARWSQALADLAPRVAQLRADARAEHRTATAKVITAIMGEVADGIRGVLPDLTAVLEEIAKALAKVAGTIVRAVGEELPILPLLLIAGAVLLAKK